MIEHLLPEKKAPVEYPSVSLLLTDSMENDFSKVQNLAISYKYQKCVKNMKLAISNLLTTSGAEISGHSGMIWNKQVLTSFYLALWNFSTSVPQAKEIHLSAQG